MSADRICVWSKLATGQSCARIVSVGQAVISTRRDGSFSVASLQQISLAFREQVRCFQSASVGPIFLRKIEQIMSRRSLADRLTDRLTELLVRVASGTPPVDTRLLAGVLACIDRAAQPARQSRILALSNTLSESSDVISHVFVPTASHLRCPLVRSLVDTFGSPAPLHNLGAAAVVLCDLATSSQRFSKLLERRGRVFMGAVTGVELERIWRLAVHHKLVQPNVCASIALTSQLVTPHAANDMWQALAKYGSPAALSTVASGLLYPTSSLTNALYALQQEICLHPRNTDGVVSLGRQLVTSACLLHPVTALNLAGTLPSVATSQKKTSSLAVIGRVSQLHMWLQDGVHAFHPHDGFAVEFHAFCTDLRSSGSNLSVDLLQEGLLEAISYLAIRAIIQYRLNPGLQIEEIASDLCAVLLFALRWIHTAPVQQDVLNDILARWCRCVAHSCCAKLAGIEEDAGTISEMQQQYNLGAVAALAVPVESLILEVFGMDGSGTAAYPALQRVLADEEATPQKQRSVLQVLAASPLASTCKPYLHGLRSLASILTSELSAPVTLQASQIRWSLQDSASAFIDVARGSSSTSVTREVTKPCTFKRSRFYWKHVVMISQHVAQFHKGAPDAILDTSTESMSSTETGLKRGVVAQHARSSEKLSLRRHAVAGLGVVINTALTTGVHADLLHFGSLLQDCSILDILSACLYDPDATVRNHAIRISAEFCKWVWVSFDKQLLQTSSEGSFSSNQNASLRLFMSFTARFCATDVVLALVRRFLVYWQTCIVASGRAAGTNEEAAAVLHGLSLLETQVNLRRVSGSVWRTCGVLSAVAKLTKGAGTKGIEKAAPSLHDSVPLSAFRLLQLLQDTRGDDNLTHLLHQDSAFRAWMASKGVGSLPALEDSWHEQQAFLVRFACRCVSSESDSEFTLPSNEEESVAFMADVEQLNISFPALRRNFNVLFGSRSVQQSKANHHTLETVIVSYWSIITCCWRIFPSLSLSHKGRKALAMAVTNAMEIMADALSVGMHATQLILGDPLYLWPGDHADTAPVGHDVTRLPGVGVLTEMMMTIIPVNPFEADIARELQSQAVRTLGDVLLASFNAVVINVGKSRAATLGALQLLRSFVVQHCVQALAVSLESHASFLHDILRYKTVHVHAFGNAGRGLQLSSIGRSNLFSCFSAMCLLTELIKWPFGLIDDVAALSSECLAAVQESRLMHYVCSDMLADSSFLDSSTSGIPSGLTEMVGRHPVRLEATAYCWLLGALCVAARSPTIQHDRKSNLMQFIASELASCGTVQAERGFLWSFKDVAIQPSVCTVLQAVAFLSPGDSLLNTALASVGVPSAAMRWSSCVVAHDVQPFVDLQEDAINGWSTWRSDKLSVAPPPQSTQVNIGLPKNMRTAESSSLSRSVALASRLSQSISLQTPPSGLVAQGSGPFPIVNRQKGQAGVTNNQISDEFARGSLTQAQLPGLTPEPITNKIVEATADVLDQLGDLIVDIQHAFEKVAKPSAGPDLLSVPATMQAIAPLLLQCGFEYTPKVHERMRELGLLSSKHLSFAQFLQIIAKLLGNATLTAAQAPSQLHHNTREPALRVSSTARVASASLAYGGAASGSIPSHNLVLSVFERFATAWRADGTTVVTREIAADHLPGALSACGIQLVHSEMEDLFKTLRLMPSRGLSLDLFNDACQLLATRASIVRKQASSFLPSEGKSARDEVAEDDDAISDVSTSVET
jgi:hypothetical protein